jgi:hypothetical protein
MDIYENEIRDLDQAVTSISNAIDHINPNNFEHDIESLLYEVLTDLRLQRAKIRIVTSKISALQEEE